MSWPKRSFASKAAAFLRPVSDWAVDRPSVSEVEDELKQRKKKAEFSTASWF